MPNTRRNNALIYDLPGGLPVTGGVMANANGVQGENGIDEYSAGVNFNVGPFGAGVGYVSDEFSDNDAWVVSASVDFFGASIGAAYEHGDFTDNGASDCAVAALGGDSDYYAIEGQYKFGNNIARAGWEQCDPDNNSKATGWAVGLQHNLSARTLVGLEYQDFDNALFPDDIDQQQAVLHFRHSF
jgi:predicted porin